MYIVKSRQTARNTKHQTPNILSSIMSVPAKSPTVHRETARNSVHFQSEILCTYCERRVSFYIKGELQLRGYNRMHKARRARQQNMPCHEPGLWWGGCGGRVCLDCQSVSHAYYDMRYAMCDTRCVRHQMFVHSQCPPVYFCLYGRKYKEFYISIFMNQRYLYFQPDWVPTTKKTKKKSTYVPGTSTKKTIRQIARRKNSGIFPSTKYYLLS